MLTAIITPVRRQQPLTADDEATLDRQIEEANRRGLVPCHPYGHGSLREFRIAFFRPEHIPAGWRRFAAVTTPQDTPPCAA